MEYIAHRDPVSGRTQSALAHLTATAELAADFARPFDAAQTAYLCGLLHDVGKYSLLFQKRVRPGGENIRVDHATAGALEAKNLEDFGAAFCIAGHHGGLPDRGDQHLPADGTLMARFKKEVEDYSAYRTEVSIPPEYTPKRIQSDPFFFAHMLFSCLVDADWLDTEAFMQNGAVKRGTGQPLPELLKKLEAYVSKWWDGKGPLNVRRCEILRTLLEGGNRERGLYTLTVPTGGGKTVGSMAFALRHAVHTGQRRIIYVIPYTSILEQTQEVFEEIFGAENVVAHYANVTYPTDENGNLSDVDQRRYLASENWDAPIILTTAVQFFESLFGNRSSQCRKLHNIAQSIVIFDEAQMLPVNYLRPCVFAIAELVRNYGCTAVLCTATQPALDPLLKEFLPKTSPVELCPPAPERDGCFRRVCYQVEGKLSDEALAERLRGERQALCVVNSRAQAQKLYRMLPEEGSFHLSTTMTAEHRRRVLREVRERLKEGLPCRVVSTSLIEAGVDVSFPTVYRALAGLDSIIQAAGRCNRENLSAAREHIVHVFEGEAAPPAALRQNIAAAREVLRKFADLSSPEAVRAYFSTLLDLLKGNSALDKEGILRLAKKEDMAFRTVAERFHLIADAGRTVYIPLGDGAALVEELQKNGPSRKLLRQLGLYAVSVYEGYYRALLEVGALEPIAEDAAILRDTALYDQHTGLALTAEGGKAMFE